MKKTKLITFIYCTLIITLIISCQSQVKKELLHSVELTTTLINEMNNAKEIFSGIMHGNHQKVKMVATLEKFNVYIKEEISPYLGSHTSHEMLGVKKQFIKCINAALITIENYNQTLDINKYDECGAISRKNNIDKASILADTLDKTYLQELSYLKTLIKSVADKYKFLINYT